MTHLNDEKLRAFADGRLSGEDQEQVERHVLECPVCSERLDQLPTEDAFVAFVNRVASSQSGAGKGDAGITLRQPVDTQRRDAAGGLPGRNVKMEPAEFAAATSGRYVLESELGRGGVAVVYRARDTIIGRDVAIKILTSEPGEDEANVRRFLREVNAIGRLNHPHVVTIYDIGEVQGARFLVMEHLPGGSLARRVRREGRLPWREANRLVSEVCRGLNAAHNAGVIHRDIKPHNILLTMDDQAKLADFGLARVATAIDSNRIMGSPHYMSPEQCLGRSVDAPSDIYSLGATYYSLLTGKQPYEDAGGMVQIMTAHCSGDLLDPQQSHGDIPKGCAEIVFRAMAKSPADRFSTAGQFAAALENVVG